MKADSGRYVDMIDLKTDSKIQPHIKIGVFGNILPQEKQKDPDPSQNAGKEKK